MNTEQRSTIKNLVFGCPLLGSFSKDSDPLIPELFLVLTRHGQNGFLRALNGHDNQYRIVHFKTSKN